VLICPSRFSHARAENATRNTLLCAGGPGADEQSSAVPHTVATLAPESDPKTSACLSLQPVQGQANSAQLSLTLAARQLEPLAAGLEAFGDALPNPQPHTLNPPCFSVQAAQGQGSSAQLSLTLAARQLEALAAGLKAVGHAISRETLAEDIGRLYNRAGKAGWLADQSRELQAQVG
jgi:hypothetical protein